MHSFPFSHKQNILPLTVISAGHKLLNKNTPPVCLPNGTGYHQLLFTKSGSGTVCINDKSINVNSDSIIYFKPEAVRQYYTDSDKWDVYYVTYSQNVLFNFLDIDSGVYLIKNSKQYIDTVNTIKNVKADCKFCIQASAYLFYLLLDINNSLNIEKKDISSFNKLQPAINYINLHFSETLTLDDIAASANMSKEHFCRIFKKAYKIRPFEYIQALRIQKAKSLLISMYNTNIQDISTMVGYENASYFSKKFKESENISPTEFKKSYNTIRYSKK